MGDDSAPIENATFLVRDGQIIQTGSTGDVEVPAGADRVDLSGKTVMPGIIDTHTHLRTDARETLIEDLQRRAYYGVVATSEHGAGSRRCAVPGSRGRGSECLPIPSGWAWDLGSGARQERHPVLGGRPKTKARQAIRELAELNVDLVKIWVDDRDGMYEKLSPEIYGAIIDEAHMNGLRVTAHIFTLEDGKGLLRAGLDAFAHGVRDRDIDDELRHALPRSVRT